MRRTPLLAIVTAMFMPLASWGRQATTTQADVEAIKALLDEYCTTVNTGDLDGYSALFADDAMSMPPTAPARTGKEGIRSAVGALLEENTVQLTSQIVDVRVSGDLAFLHVTYNETVTPKAGGEPTEYHGLWLVILQRQPDGSWKWWREMWSNYTPPEM